MSARGALVDPLDTRRRRAGTRAIAARGAREPVSSRRDRRTCGSTRCGSRHLPARVAPARAAARAGRARAPRRRAAPSRASGSSRVPRRGVVRLRRSRRARAPARAVGRSPVALSARRRASVDADRGRAPYATCCTSGRRPCPGDRPARRRRRRRRRAATSSRRHGRRRRRSRQLTGAHRCQPLTRAMTSTVRRKPCASARASRTGHAPRARVPKSHDHHRTGDPRSPHHSRADELADDRQVVRMRDVAIGTSGRRAARPGTHQHAEAPALAERANRPVLQSLARRRTAARPTRTTTGRGRLPAARPAAPPEPSSPISEERGRDTATASARYDVARGAIAPCARSRRSFSARQPRLGEHAARR